LLIGKELWGFYTPAGVSPSEVKVATAQVQPYYAVPTRYMGLGEFPQTTNGKVDKRALRRLAEVQIEATAAAALASAATADKSHARRGSLAKSLTVHPAHTARKSVTEVPTAGPSRQVSARRASAARHGHDGSLSLRTSLFVDLHGIISPKKPFALQRCNCDTDNGHPSSQIHVVSLLVPNGCDILNGVEVYAVQPSRRSPWSPASSPLNSPTQDRCATCALLVIGGHILSTSQQQTVASMCLSCRGWVDEGLAAGKDRVSRLESSSGGYAIGKELVTDVACALLAYTDVDLVRVVSDSQTSHALVNELGHRGVAVQLQMAV